MQNCSFFVDAVLDLSLNQIKVYLKMEQQTLY